MSGFTPAAAPAPANWAVQWLMSRRATDEQTAVLTMSSEVLDGIQDKHDERRVELMKMLDARLDQIANMDFGITDTNAQEKRRATLIRSAQEAHDKAIARLDSRSDSIHDVQRIIVRR